MNWWFKKYKNVLIFRAIQNNYYSTCPIDKVFAWRHSNEHRWYITLCIIALCNNLRDRDLKRSHSRCSAVHAPRENGRVLQYRPTSSAARHVIVYYVLCVEHVSSKGISQKYLSLRSCTFSDRLCDLKWVTSQLTVNNNIYTHNNTCAGTNLHSPDAADLRCRVSESRNINYFHIHVDVFINWSQYDITLSRIGLLFAFSIYTTQ